MRSLGIDIGTTTICGAVIDSTNGKVIESITLPNISFIESSNPFEKIQDPEIIVNTAKKILSDLTNRHSPISSVGITGQMHGILYVNEMGIALSPLYTWQDGRGNLTLPQSVTTYVDYLNTFVKQPVATGYGLVTHYYNVENGIVPAQTKSLCTIPDYLAMRLTNTITTKMHVSSAASIGFFNLEKNAFDEKALKAIGLDSSILPKVTSEFEQVGVTADNWPVFVAVGDNQASFWGSVNDSNNCILVNVGTGSQISLLVDKYISATQMETRRCTGSNYLLVGSSLCGGRAYAILHNFYKSVIESCNLQADNLYHYMDALAENYNKIEDKLNVHNAFSGTREQPDLRGSIENISISNFDAVHLTCGILEATANELFEKYYNTKSLINSPAPTILIGSGNGIRKGKVLQKMFVEKFGMKLKIPDHNEEAAFGAALTSLVGIKCFDSIEQAQKIINYIEIC